MLRQQIIPAFIGLLSRAKLWGYTRFESEQLQQTIALPTNFTKINAAAFAIDKYGLTCFSVQKLSLSNIIFKGSIIVAIFQRTNT